MYVHVPISMGTRLHARHGTILATSRPFHLRIVGGPGHGRRAREGQRLIVETFLRLVASRHDAVTEDPAAEERLP